ncbi:MAG: hypothetical protein IKK34_07980 [Clostridia bacterium]|nr:hypothetical protein [Clostridia bacterium]
MSDYVFLNTTLRRVDGGRVTSVEVDALDEFFNEEYGRCCYNCRPYVLIDITERILYRKSGNVIIWSKD